MNNLAEKIKKHPKSQVARAYKLGKADAERNGLLPLLKPTIRYFMLRGTFKTRKQLNEFSRLTALLEELTK